MTQIIDALVITLGLDPKNFNDNQKKTADVWLKTVAGFQKGGKQVEESSKRAAETVNLITRRVLELFAVITGSRALTEFASKIITADAALGRFASSLGETPQRLSEWENASERFGGSAEATASSLERVNRQLFDLNRNGQTMPREFYQLQAWAGGKDIDTSHGVSAYLTDVSAKLQRLHAIDAGAAHSVAEALGIDSGTEQAMYRLGPRIKSYLDTLKDLSPTNAAIDAAQRLQTSWIALRQQATALGNAILESVGPAIADVIDKMTKWIDKNQDWINSKISDAFKAVSEYLGNINWADINAGFQKFANIATTTASAIASIAANLATVAGWVTGTPPSAAPVDPNYDADAWKKKLGGGALTPEAPLDPSVMNNNLDRSSTNSIQKPGETTVDGRPVSKSNPVPVTISDQKSDGGGFWSNFIKGVGSLFGGAGSGAGGAGASAGAMVGPKGSAASVPNVGGMTDDERNTLGLIMKHESGGGNVMNYMGRAEGTDPTTAKGYTAQGYYQILNSNWRRLAPKLGIKARNAMDASLEDQTKVALALLRESGVGNWSNYNPSLKTALRRGDRVAMGAAASAVGAKAAALSNISSTHSATTSTSSVENHIGKVEVVSQATDATGIASDLHSALSRRLLAAKANYGLA